jgi:Holliday junction resolvase
LTSYERGAKFERNVKKILESLGLLVVRSAGSHGPVDLVALGESKVFLLQFKAEKYRTKGSVDLEDLVRASRSFAYTVPVLVDKPKFGEVRFINLHDGSELEL